ncbi:MAG: CDP-glycerol glycerophosphotransferase family protein [Chlamydiia bacterium]|nr:CDP-glycerol glycerophosphotransferase family protein [Chlamydiia bacterium]
MESLHLKQYSAGLIYDDSRHYLDHLAPLCALMRWPLIALDPTVAELARRYYPDLEVIEEGPLPPTLIVCDLLQDFAGHKIFWLPHGHSDKGPFFKGLLKKEIALIYGQQMLDTMHAEEVYPTHIRIGNFRYHYYLKHQAFYDKLLPCGKGKNILYAPTWDENNSFWDHFPRLAASIGNIHQLLVKLHPNTEARFAPELEVFKGRYGNKNITFLEDFPPIYPLLQHTEIYIGDMSSIGYDFLTFNRPMFFFHPHKALSRLCGREFQVGFVSDKQIDLAPQRAHFYKQTFDFVEDWESVGALIRAAAK